MMAQSSITVAVESAIHDALMEVLQRISELHQIQVERVSVEWLDVSMAEKKTYLVHRVNITSEKVHR